MSQAWRHVFLNLRHNSFKTKKDQNGGKFERFSNLLKRLHFIQIEFFSQHEMMNLRILSICVKIRK